ncbi:acetylornithine/succinylornithine family transaminase [Clostridium sp. D2Q-14]|uniref:aspartate aminotransferase family protein n=1 Tax=Anaeromonas gelatinilytica TaxID=2683194 RepID=UPI00193B1481|nr:acetylornithine/succinylornithine family transaminase [Anaeromonas gelatinilytica]MBS4534646.1 acetylornithine/succinylornithine family transaminase [Anaeromonas gelatinilytica]
MINIVKEDKEYILNTYNRIDLEIIKGDGLYLYDNKGNSYLDMFSGISVNHLGHGNSEIIKNILEQASKYIHLSNHFASKTVVNLAKLLVENTFASKVFFTNSGTEANEGALKLARKFGRGIDECKIEILSAYNSFHGRTMGGLSLTGQKKYQDSFSPLIPHITHFLYNDVKDLKAKVNHKTCAVFIEIIQGEGGIIEISPYFVKALDELSREYNFLIVVDEIQTGLGRVGGFLASDLYNINPHIITLAKSLGGGLPLGAMLVSKEIENVLKPGDHGSTFGGNPVACAAGEVLISEVIQDEFRKKTSEKSKYLFNRLYELQKMYPNVIKNIRGKGLMIGVDVGEYADTIKNMALDRKLLLNVTNRTVIRLLPPLNISFREIDDFIDIFRKVLSIFHE